MSAADTALPEEAKLIPRKSRALVSESERYCCLRSPKRLYPFWTPKLSKLKAKMAGSPHPTSDLPLLPNSRSVLDYSELGSAPPHPTPEAATSMTLLGHLPVYL